MKLYRPRTWPREQVTAVDGENRCTWTAHVERSLLEDRAFLVLEMDQASGATVTVKGSAPLFVDTNRLAEDHFLAEAIVVPDVDKTQPLEIGLQTRGEIPHYVEETEEYTYYVNETYTYTTTETYTVYDERTRTYPIYKITSPERWGYSLPGDHKTRYYTSDRSSIPSNAVDIEHFPQVREKVGEETKVVTVPVEKTRQVTRTGTRSVPKTGTRTALKNYPFTADWSGSVAIHAPDIIEPRMHNELFSGSDEPIMIYVGGADESPLRGVGTQANWLTRATDVDPRALLYQVVDAWIGGPYGTPLKLSPKSTALPYLSADIYTV